MRVGGIGYTVRRGLNSVPEFPRTEQTVNGVILDFPNPAGYVKIVDDCRENGFEPMITVPFNDRNKLRSVEEQALEAADIVRTVNHIHKRNVKYWIIGNEPEETQDYTGTLDNAMMVRKYLMAFSKEMKNVDPDILIIGPDMENANDDYFPTLFTNTASAVTGTVSTGSGPRYYLDYVSYHNYGGFNSAFTTTTNATRRERYVNGGYELTFSLTSTFAKTYTTYVQSNNTSRTVPLKLILNEFNVHNITSTSVPTIILTQTLTSEASLNAMASDDVSGNTFLAGQYIVDQMAGMLSVKDVSNNAMFEFSNVWSVGESGTSYGLIHSNTDKKPTYWHYWLMSRYFNGTFYPCTPSASIAPGINRCYKAYACKASDYIAVLVMNQSQSTNSADVATFDAGTKNFSISFNNSSANFQFSMGGTSTAYNGTIAPSSTSLLFFNCDGSQYMAGMI